MKLRIFLAYLSLFILVTICYFTTTNLFEKVKNQNIRMFLGFLSGFAIFIIGFVAGYLIYVTLLYIIGKVISKRKK